MSVDRAKRVVPTADEIKEAIKLVKYAEHNSDFSSEQLVNAAIERKEDERSAMDYLLLSSNEWKDGNYEKSLRHAYTGLAAGSDDPVVMACLETRLGTVFHDLGSEDRSWELAEECYDAAMEMAPKFPLPYIFSGDLQFDQDEFEDAELSYKRAKELDPDDPNTYNSLGYLYLEQDKTKEAEAEFLKAKELSPELPIVHLHLATLFQDQGRLPEAIAEFRTAIKLYPENALWYNHLGTLLIDQGELKEAKEILDKAIKLAPENEAVLEVYEQLQKKLK